MVGVRLDLHVHSVSSPDSVLTLDAIASGIAAAGLDGFALTDHNTTAGHSGIAALRERFPHLLIVPGIEVSTLEGHLLAFGITMAPPAGLPAAGAIEWVRSRGGVTALSHPFRLSHGVGEVLAETLKVDAIETVNGHNSAATNEKARRVAGRRGLATTGGSDSHQRADLGRAYTTFPAGTNTVEEVLRALREKATVAEGRPLTWFGRLRHELRTALLRLRRGGRPI